jgi:hypothetical protein
MPVYKDHILCAIRVRFISRYAISGHHSKESHNVNTLHETLSYATDQEL